MSEIRNELRYTKSHEWVREEEDGSFTIGITDHAQALLGDLVFVELPEVGNGYGEGDEIAVVESVKAAADVYSPVSGEVIAVNEDLTDNPELVNSSAYDDGWLFRLQPIDGNSIKNLMDAETYQDSIEAEAH